ncbi:MAG TPA: hypothetical protein PLV65_04410 [Tenuifilaceae bacterium]|nr:hypothetical protein [Tenuifilaceae bacterium]
MRLFLHVLTIIIFTASCNSQQNNSPKDSGLQVEIEVDDVVTLPELDGVDVYIKNQSEQTIKIWDNVNPSGLIDLFFLFETEEHEKLLIKPVVLNWKDEFSKVLAIEAHKKIKLNPQLTHWTVDDSQIEQSDTIFSGKLKACYAVKQPLENEADLWKGEVFSNEVQTELKHNRFVNKK